jgi:predicted ATPase/class 3 adenylate cyclase
MRRCPACNFENTESAKFCSNCGNRLPERATAGTSERRVVTVLFCDVKGSTTLAEKMDPEDWTEIIDGAFRILTPPIHRYGGTVARLLGDAVLAFFGAPIAHEDDPERAVRAGLEMLQATGIYRARLVQERGEALRAFDIRIGINTGLAVVGDVGTGQAVEYTGMGDVVNVAARLQTLAEPGTMLVSDHTFRLLPPIFESHGVGETDVKGREAKVGIYAIRGISTSSGRPKARGIVGPLVGRAPQMAALREALAELRGGGGRIVSLIGEAGLGKTRLIDELRKEWDAAPREGGIWCETRGQSYEQQRSYGLFRQQVLALAGVTEADPPEVIRQRVLDLVPDAKRSDEHCLRALEVFMAVESDSPSPGPEGQELRNALHDLVRDIIRRFSGSQAVLVFDDLQWSDAASADLLTSLFDLTDEAPVLFICAFRPDRQSPAWRVKQALETDHPHRYHELKLEPLSADESDTLLASLLSGGPLPGQLRERVLDRAEGNPFFLEEIVRALLDDATIVREGEAWRISRPDAEIRLPDSLQAVLAARIDRLEAESRETLQAAAVIGRTFLYRILVAIREATDKLDRQLLSLQRLELVREQSREPERQYAFRHALTQEAAYGSILQRKRRELHLRVGEALEKLFPERADEFAAIIGHHYAEAADGRAARFLQLAGDRALRLHALEDAATHYRRTLALIRRDEVDAGTLTDLYLKYGRALELRGEYAAAIPVYEELERIAHERGDAAMEGAALSALTTIYTNPTDVVDHQKAAALLARQIDLARERNDEKLLARLLWNRAQVGFWQMDADMGLPEALASAAIAERIGDDEQLAYTLNGLGQIYREQNKLDASEASLRRALELFRKVGNRPLEADTLSTLAFVHMYRCEFDESLARGMEAYAIGREIGNDWAQAYGLFMPGYVHFERGEVGQTLDTWDEMLVHAEKGGFLAGRTGVGSDRAYAQAYAGDSEAAVSTLLKILDLAAAHFPAWEVWVRATLARVLVERGDLARATGTLASVTADPGAVGRGLYLPIYLALARGELALAEGRPADALAKARNDRVLATERGLRPFTKDFDLLEAQALRATGELDGARIAYERGIAESRRTGSLRLLWQLLGGLATVADARGDVAAGRTARDEAARIIDRIADSLRRRGLDGRFRERTPVREALGLVAAGR